MTTLQMFRSKWIPQRRVLSPLIASNEQVMCIGLIKCSRAIVTGSDGAAKRVTIGEALRALCRALTLLDLRSLRIHPKSYLAIDTVKVFVVHVVDTN